MIRWIDTWYGISVTTIAIRPFLISWTSATARILTDPRPVRRASLIPPVPTM